VFLEGKVSVGRGIRAGGGHHGGKNNRHEYTGKTQTVLSPYGKERGIHLTDFVCNPPGGA